VSTVTETRRDVRDRYGRRCWLGPSDRVLLGYPRALVTSGALGIGAAAGGPPPRRPGWPGWPRTLPQPQ
jgi:hypothetical protein